jgi:hypothetical protein
MLILFLFIGTDVSFFYFHQWICCTRQKYNHTIDSWVIWQVCTLAFPCITVWSLYNMTSIQLLVSLLVASTVGHWDYCNAQLWILLWIAHVLISLSDSQHLHWWKGYQVDGPNQCGMLPGRTIG